MKKTVAKDKVQLAISLHSAVELRKGAAKREKELKAKLADIMGDAQAMQFGDYVVTQEMAHRSGWNSELLISELGEDVDHYKKVTHFTKMAVRSC